MLFRQLAGIAATGLLCALAPAEGAQIGFDDLPADTDTFAEGATYEEDGFRIEVGAGTTFGFRSGGDITQSDPPVFVAGLFGAPEVGDFVLIERADGGAFTAGTIDVRSDNGLLSDSVDFLGFSGGVDETNLVGAMRGVSTEMDSFQTIDIGITAVIDALVIEVSGPGETALLLDNIELTATEIPAPGALVLFASVLAGGGAMRRRGRARG